MTILDAALHDIIVPFISVISQNLQVFQKCADNKVYDVCETRDVLVFLIMLNTSMEVDAVEQVRDHGIVFRCIISGDTEQLLAQIEIHQRVEDILGEILPRVHPFQGLECQETIVQLEFRVDPMCSNLYLFVSRKSPCNVQNNVSGVKMSICTLHVRNVQIDA